MYGLRVYTKDFTDSKSTTKFNISQAVDKSILSE
jgi:hypothetical protein